MSLFRSPCLKLGFPKQSCSERISVFAVVASKICSYFSAAPTVWWQGVEEGGNSIASSLNVSLLEGLCLWAATFTGVSPVALPSPHAFYPYPGCMQYSQIISWKPWPLLTALFPLGDTRMLEGTRGEGIPFLHLGSGSSKIFSMESRPCQGKGSGGTLTVITLSLTQPQKPGHLSQIFTMKTCFMVVSMISRRLNKCSQIHTVLKAYIISCLLISIVIIC